MCAGKEKGETIDVVSPFSLVSLRQKLRQCDFLPDVNAVGIVNAAGGGNRLVMVGVAIETLGNFAQRIARFDGVFQTPLERSHPR